MEKRISVRFQDSTLKALNEASRFYGRTTSEIIREAVCEWLEKKGFLRRRI